MSFSNTYGSPYVSYSLYAILPLIALLVILAGGLALYFLFVRKPNTFHGAAAKLHDTLTFRTFFTERLLRMLYCITVAALIVYSIILLFSHVFMAIALFIVGNLIARIVFEFALLLLVLCRNTQEINRKINPQPPVQPAAPQQPFYQAPRPAAPQPQAPMQPPVRPQAPAQPQTPPQDGPQQ